MSVLAEGAATSTDDGTGEVVEITDGENTDGKGEAADGEDGSNGTSTTGTTDGGDGETATSTDGSGDDGEPGTGPDGGENAASSTDGASASTNDPGGDGTNGDTNEDGTDGFDPNTTTTDPCGDEAPNCNATSTDQIGSENDGPDGTEGGTGTAGEDGGTNADQEDESEPVPVVSENEVADDATPDDGEEITGGRTVDGDRNRVRVVTGEATAQAELFSDANSGVIKSEIDVATFGGDLDNYYFNATGTNEALITNSGSVLALTGSNLITTEGGPAEISSGNAYGALNIANVANTTVVNSDGFLYLGNRILEPNQSLDLTDFFFPDPDGELARATDCNLLSCVAEDIHYNFSQENTATITNNANVEVVTGENEIYTKSSFSDIYTGEAYGGANIINVVNTNIVDSNYRFLTLNAMGDLDGDLLLPTQELFNAFYSRPNGMTQLEDVEDFHATIENTNDAEVDNSLDTYAETGLNVANTNVQPTIVTGDASSESNVLSKINSNIFGGDVMYLLIRVHGDWDGQVRGLPEGLTWIWTQEGVLIYNEGAEIVPSPLLPYDVDSYNAKITDYNAVSINNNLTIDAITGDNEVGGGTGSVVTGDAFASANVMNVANTNVIGANWTFAVINIFGDFAGDIAFTAIDLTLTGKVSKPDPLGLGDLLTYSYTVHNNSTKPASNVVLEQTLENATHDGASLTASVYLGDLNPGESVTTEVTATVDSDLPFGTTTVKSVAVVNSDEAEATPSDNAVAFNLDAYLADPSGDTGTTTDDRVGTTTDDETVSTTDDGTGTSTNDGTDGSNQTTTEIDNGGNGGGGRSSGSGGGSSTNTKSIDREELEPIDPNKASMLVITKESNVDEDDIVEAGDSVDYTITLRNRGGTAYDTVVYDIFKNPIDAVLSEQSWELGTILAGEEITIEYTTTFDADTPSGTYTNTASVEAYRHEDDKESGADPLKLDTAVHTLEIDGVPVVVGNVGVVAYYPGTTGTNALISWETNTPATGQIFYSPRYLGSSYNPLLPNHGYAHESFKFNTPKTKHYMILRDLVSGTEYAYKVRSTSGVDEAVGGDYYLTVPTNVTSLAIALPNGQVAQIAGAATSRTVTPITPTPAPSSGPTSYVPTPSPQPKPEPEPQPEPEPSNTSDEGGGIFGRVLNFFR